MTIACIVDLFEYDFLTESSFSKSIFRLVFEEVTVDQTNVLQKLNDETFDVNDALIRLFSVSILEALTLFNIQFSWVFITQVFNFAFICLSIALGCIEDKNIFFLIYIYLIFLRSLATVEKTMTYIERDIFWIEIYLFLNTLIKSNILIFRIFGKNVSELEKNIARSLFEDFIIRK